MLSDLAQGSCRNSVWQRGTRPLAYSIVELAAAGLPQMYIPERRLFCNILRQDADGRMRQIGISHRYTMMTLLGLDRLEAAGWPSPISIGPVLDELLRDLTWITCAGDLGNLLWLCAIVAPTRLAALVSRIDWMAARNYKDFHERSTTELAWFLAGLALAKQAAETSNWKYDAIAVETYSLLSANQGPKGIFGHVAADRSLRGRLRGSIGSFADQVYPILALAHFGQVFGDTRAINRAESCAEMIVELQGADGEWWWHYDARTGRVIRPYPVYSVHQDGMAPMALQALSAVTGREDFTPALERGLRWIAGSNTLNLDMRDRPQKLIWRSIAFASRSAKVQELACFLSGRSPRPVLQNPHVVRECRPYELGWALYALASPHGRAMPGRTSLRQDTPAPETQS
jgi:hypothetical protein